MRHTTGTGVCRHSRSSFDLIPLQVITCEATALWQPATRAARDLIADGPIRWQLRHEHLPLAASRFHVDWNREWSVYRVEQLTSSTEYFLASRGGSHRGFSPLSVFLHGLRKVYVQRVTMPRSYKCRKCGNVHGPPTGKHCREVYHVEPVTETNEGTDIVRMLNDIQRQLRDMGTDNRPVANASAGGVESDSEESMLDIDTGELEGAAAPMPVPDGDMTPALLRRNTAIMNRAADRLARVRELDDEVETTTDGRKTRTGGKKSGSMIVAGESVIERIDWPHMYVTRMTNGRRKGVAYTDLRAEEFSYGFMAMIESPLCTWDYRVMTRVFRIVMQDAMNISWPFALALYEAIGHDVEQGVMEWDDIERINEYRFNYAHNTHGEKKDTQAQARDSGRPPLRAAPPGMRCCASFQSHTCELTRDHAPFTHACAYCLKVCSAICRHAEADCIRKVTDASKNVKRRE